MNNISLSDGKLTYAQELKKIDDFSANPAKLVDFFETVCNKENCWQFKNTESFIYLYKKIKELDSEGKLNEILIKKIMSVSNNIYQGLVDPAIKIQNTSFFYHHINDLNVYDNLKNAKDANARDHIVQCLDYIFKLECSVHITLNADFSLSMIIHSVSYDKLSAKITNLANIFDDKILIMLRPKDIKSTIDLHQFIEYQGQHIQHIDFRDLVNVIDDNFVEQSIKNCHNLITLSIKSNNIIGGVLEKLFTLKNLIVLDLSGCGSLTNLPSVWPESLEMIDLSHCNSLIKITTPWPLNLTNLNLSDCCNLTRLHINWPASLKTLNLSGCSNLNNIPTTWSEKLTTLNLSDCNSLIAIPAHWPVNLLTLNLSGYGGGLTELRNPWPEKLTTLNLSDCYNLTKIHATWPKGLATLDLSNCINLTVFSKHCPISLTNLNLSECYKIDDNHRFEILSSICDQDKTQLFRFCLLLKIKDSVRLSQLIFDKLELNDVVEELSRLTESYGTNRTHFGFMKQLLSELMVRDFNLFLNNLDRLLAPNFYKEVQSSINDPKWKALLALNPNRIKSATTQDESVKIELKDIPEIQIEELLTLFEKVNFTDQSKDDYINPENLKFDGSSITVKGLKDALAKILHHIKNKLNYLAIPKEENQRSEWYQNLSYALKLFIQLSKCSQEPLLASSELLRVAGSGTMCGTRWLRETQEAIETLQGSLDLKIEGLDQLITQWFDEYKFGLIEDFTTLLSRKIGRGNQPHIYNSVAKEMIELGFKLSSNRMIDLKDPLIPNWTNIGLDIKPLILRGFSSSLLLTFILNKIKEELKSKPTFGDSVLIPFNEYAENQLSKKIMEIEESLPAKKIQCGINQARHLLKKSQMVQVIVEDNQEAISNYKKSDFRMFTPILREESAKLKRIAEDNVGFNNDQPLKKQKNDHVHQDKGIKRKAEYDLIEDDERLSKKQKINSEIDKYIQMIKQPELFNKELEILGEDAAHLAIKEEKEALISQFLDSERLVTVDEMTGDVNVTFSGALTLLQHLNYLS